MRTERCAKDVEPDTEEADRPSDLQIFKSTRRACGRVCGRVDRTGASDAGTSYKDEDQAPQNNIDRVHVAERICVHSWALSAAFVHVFFLILAVFWYFK